MRVRRGSIGGLKNEATTSFFDRPIGLRSESGQAMVEFAIMLIIVFALCTGMIYVTKLLNFDYWAQQEARYLAFEQTWHAREYYGSAVEPIANLTDLNSPLFIRPRSVKKLDSTKKGDSDGGMEELFAKAELPKRPKDESQILLAGLQPGPGYNIWKERTPVFFVRLDSKFSPEAAAYASQQNREDRSTEPQLSPRTGLPEPIVTPADERSVEGIRTLLEQGGFGENFCAAMHGSLTAHGFAQSAERFSDRECSARYDLAFAEHLDRTIDFRELFEDYSFQLKSGLEPGEAIESVAEKTVAHGFYSFFDNKVKSEFGMSGFEFTGHSLDVTMGMASSEVTRLISEWRYIGSNIAVLAVAGNVANIFGHGGSGTDPLAQLNFEKSVNNILHKDATDVAFGLPLTWLPIPPTLKPMFPTLYDALAKNVFDQEQDKWDEWVDDSNRTAEITYKAIKGIPLPVRKRYKVEGRELTARFFLVTEPWHIARRESATGDYRDLGSDMDSENEPTDEGILRKRVHGLYLIPSRMGEFLKIITAFIPGADAGAGPVLEGADSVISAVKDFILDNPLMDITYTIQDYFDFLGVDFTLPRWPSVRPQSYPGTVELKDDKLTGSSRDWNAFLQEQKDNNPPAKPEYHDDDN